MLARVSPQKIPGTDARSAGLRIRLAAALLETKVGQSELARRIGVTQQTMNRWCRGHLPISRGRFLECLEALGLGLSWEPSADALEAAAAKATQDETSDPEG
jgi:transcriptional regulator with XRE-family HTH domain